MRKLIRNKQQKEELRPTSRLLDSLVFHPVLFALFPVLFLISHNIDEVAPSEGFLPGVVVVAVALLFLLIIWPVVGNLRKAAIICSAFLVVFFSYGNIYEFLSAKGWHIGRLVIGRHLVLIPLLVSIFFLLSLYVARNASDFRASTSYLNIVSLMLVIIPLTSITAYEFKSYWREFQINDLAQPMENGLSKQKRDIYYIILDAHASSKTLKEVYNYDDSEFIKALEKKGFYIAKESKSNHPMTLLSIASSLNMQYLDGSESPKPKDHSDTSKLLNNSKVVSFLKGKGYKFINFDSGFKFTSNLKNADTEVKVKAATLDRFSMMLLRSTMLQPYTKNLIADDVRNRHIYTFYKLSEIPNIEGPKFVFAHIVAPHQPYVFGRNGEPVKDVKLGRDVFENSRGGSPQQYLDQLIYIDKKVVWLVNELLRKSKTKPIIIIQADHGPGEGGLNAYKELRANRLSKESAEFIRKRASILNAYYLPGGGDSQLYQSISPVNTFRLVFNYYFGTALPLLKDKTYYSPYEDPYNFIEVPKNILQ